jgi:cytochrome P450
VHEIQLQLFAGHDTTLTALVNLMMLLAQHPDVLGRARDEQRQAEVRDDRSFAALKKMPYTHQMLSEGLRLIPPVAGAFRVVTEDVSFQGYRIPRGWRVAASPPATHQVEPWCEPERFDPDRFAPGREAHKPPSGSFIPFGGGLRVCLGQHFAMVEMAIVMALLLRHYEWTLVPGQDLEIAPLPFPRPRSGLQVRFRRAGS